jgi:hypothetical protein
MELLQLELLQVIQLLAVRFLMVVAVAVVLDITCLTKELQNLEYLVVAPIAVGVVPTTK